MKNKIINENGFTLIELLVSVAIISLLTSIVLASLVEARKKSEISKWRQYMRQVVIGIELYRDNTGLVPGGTGNSYLKNYTSGILKNFITTQVPPKNHNEPILRRLNGAGYTCGSPTTDMQQRFKEEPYYIFWTTTNGVYDDSFPRLYYGANGPYPYYCASLKRY
jgi:prepilin-type N-terminal cleavage/methylation domain-containing protein